MFVWWTWDSFGMDLASSQHDSSIIFTWFWAHFDMIFWWFSNDFDDVLEWSQKHSDQVSAPVLDPSQNRSYRALVNRNPGFQAQLRSLYRPDHPGTTSPKSPGLLTLNSPSQEGLPQRSGNNAGARNYIRNNPKIIRVVYQFMRSTAFVVPWFALHVVEWYLVWCSR